LLCAAGLPAPAAEAPTAFPTGVLVEGVVSLADPGQTYTLLLPAGYPQGGPAPAPAPAPAGEAAQAPEPSTDGDGESNGAATAPRRWPTLLIFDPRGRSRHAAELFLEGAQRHGWILISSDGTRSDGPWEPNERALAALLPELRRFAVDPGRLYAAGFSGGAHVAWLLGRTGSLAGVIASGGREGAEWMADDVPFASFGAAGTLDFNYAGMHAIDAHFGRRGAPHRLEIFEGVHRWMPPELATEAVGWMEVVAMGQGQRPVDRLLAADLYAADLERARELEGDGELLRAAERYRAILRTYPQILEPAPDSSKRPTPERTMLERSKLEAPELDSSEPDSSELGSPELGEPDSGDRVAPDLAVPAARLAALEARDDYAEAVRQRRRWADYEAAYGARLGRALAELESPQRPVSTARLARRLEIGRLQRLAAEEGASRAQRRTAGRLLASAFVQTAFYLHRDLRAGGQIRQAVAVLEVARQIRPDDPVVLYNLACARALAGREKEALEALRAAVDAGFTNAELLRTDDDLRSLHGREAFDLLLERLDPAG